MTPRSALFCKRVVKQVPTDFVCIRQTGLTDCGAACLATIFQTYHQSYAQETLRQLIPTDAAGASIQALIEAAQKCGFEACGLRGELAALTQITLPCIAHFQDTPNNHFVVIHHYENGTLIVADPAQGLVEYSVAEFAQRWSGILITLQPQGQQAITLRRIAKCLFSRLGHHRNR